MNKIVGIPLLIKKQWRNSNLLKINQLKSHISFELLWNKIVLKIHPSVYIRLLHRVTLNYLISIL